MAQLQDILKTVESTLKSGDIPSSKTHPTYNLEDGTVISFQVINSQKTAIGTKNNVEVYVGSPSAFRSYLNLATKAADTLNTVIIKENEPILEEEEPSVEEEIKYEIQGKVISDPGGDPIGGAKIKAYSGKAKYDSKVKTEETGDFTLIGDYLKSTLFKIKINSKGYGPVTVTPFNQDKTIRKNLGIIILKSNKKNLKEQKREKLLLAESQIKALKKEKLDMEMVKQKTMNKLMTTINTVLIPAILTQLLAFGISKVSEAMNTKFSDLNATCPASIKDLNKLIAKKNRLVKQLNNIYKVLQKIEIAVKVVDTIITAASVVVTTLDLLSKLPIPSVMGVPPLQHQIPTPLEVVLNKVKKYKIISSSTVMIIAILISLLEYVLSLLALLDKLIQGCAKEISSPPPPPSPITTPTLIDGEIEDEIRVDGEDIIPFGTGGISQEDVDKELLAQVQISQELLDSTQAQSHQLSPVVTNVNGFNMGVETEVTDNPLKRRRATAKNTEGVVVLTGEYSYSSNDQILIDELVFYIEQNDLKAE